MAQNKQIFQSESCGGVKRWKRHLMQVGKMRIVAGQSQLASSHKIVNLVMVISFFCICVFVYILYLYLYLQLVSSHLDF